MLHLIAVFAMAFAAAGFVLLAYRLRGKKPPRYLIPLAAGLAMIGYALWSDYSWAPRTIAETAGPRHGGQADPLLRALEALDLPLPAGRPLHRGRQRRDPSQ